MHLVNTVMLAGHPHGLWLSQIRLFLLAKSALLLACQIRPSLIYAYDLPANLHVLPALTHS